MLYSCVVLQDGMLLAVGDLDRERRDSYDLVVRASDKGTPQRQVRDAAGRSVMMAGPF